MNIFQKIAALFSSAIMNFFRGVVNDIKDNESFINGAAEFVFNIVTKAGAYINSGNYEGSIVELLIPDSLEEFSRNLLIEHLVPAFNSFTVLKEAIDELPGEPTLDQIIGAVHEQLLYIKENDPELYASVTHGLSGILAVKVGGGKITIGQVFTVLESVWQAFTKKHIQNQEIETE